MAYTLSPGWPKYSDQSLAERSGNRDPISGKNRVFIAPRPALEPTQTPMVRAPGLSFPGVERREHEPDEG
jgi:hypothetical protein